MKLQDLKPFQKLLLVTKTFTEEVEFLNPKPNSRTVATVRYTNRGKGWNESSQGFTGIRVGKGWFRGTNMQFNEMHEVHINNLKIRQ